jgi:hypothetical protein
VKGKTSGNPSKKIEVVEYIEPLAGEWSCGT